MPVSTECAAALLSFRYPSIFGIFSDTSQSTGCGVLASIYGPEKYTLYNFMQNCRRVLLFVKNHNSDRVFLCICLS